MAEFVGNGVEKNEIGVIVCGKAGIGKSTLLNNLLGTKEKFVTKGPGDDGDDCMDAGTKDVVSLSETIHGIKVTMHDTPGLEHDPTDHNYFAESMEKIKALMKENIDLVLFCIDSNACRWDGETETVKRLHLLFGDELWKNAIFVLTKSNVSQQGSVEGEPTQEKKVAKCEKVATNIFKKFKEELLKLKVPAEIVEHIPLVAAGSHNNRKLFFVAPGVYNDDFLPEFWSLAVKRCKDRSKVLFTNVTNYMGSRFVIQDDFVPLPPEEQAQIRKNVRDVVNQNSQEKMGSSLPLRPTTDEMPIKLNKKQSKRVSKAFYMAIQCAIQTGLGTSSGIGVAVALKSSAILTMSAAGLVGVGVGVGIGLMGLAAVLIYDKYKESKNISDQKTKLHCD